MDKDSRTALYRLYDANDELIYVGITNHLERRFIHHQVHQPWWNEVHHYEAEPYESRGPARAEELRLIEKYTPKYNQCVYAEDARSRQGWVPSAPPPVEEFWPVGVKEIAERLGVSVPTITTWRARSQRWMRKPPFPPPTGTISGVPWWWWHEVEDWARRTGRMPNNKQAS